MAVSGPEAFQEQRLGKVILKVGYQMRDYSTPPREILNEDLSWLVTITALILGHVPKTELWCSGHVPTILEDWHFKMLGRVSSHG